MKNFVFALIILACLLGFTLYSAYSVGRFAEEAVSLLEDGDPQAAYILYIERKSVLSLTVNGAELRLLQEALLYAMDGDSASGEQAKAICRDLREKETATHFW